MATVRTTRICNFLFGTSRSWFKQKLLVMMLAMLFLHSAFLAQAAFCDDWVLAAERFTFSQSKKQTEALEKISIVLPQLILEQISSEQIRVIPDAEEYERKLLKLQTERIDLFLQLSKEYKARDALFATKIKPKEFEKALSEAYKKISEIEVKISENLQKTDALMDEFENRKKEHEAAAPLVEAKTAEQSGFGRFLPFRFFHTDEENHIISENVSIYKKDATELFSPSEKARKDGMGSWIYQTEALEAKINGVLTGRIVSFGDYISVTVDMHVYPGGKNIGTVTEVGMVSDMVPLTKRIIQSLVPKIANSFPVLVELFISPKEALDNAVLTIDDIVYSDVPEKLILDAGIHTISIVSDGFEEETVTYSFTNDSQFFVRAKLVPSIAATDKIRLKKFKEGMFYAFGMQSAHVTEDKPRAELSVNGRNVLGVFVVKKPGEKEGEEIEETAFFRIPYNLTRKDSDVLVNAVPFDRASNIDKRRRRMYTAYTALICSLPLSFYCTGKLNTMNSAYSRGFCDYEDAQVWQTRAYLASGLSAICGTWALIELFRYLRAANQVLPAEGKIDKSIPHEEIDE